MPELLKALAGTLPMIAVGVSAVGGILALFFVNHGAMRHRTDRTAAAMIAVGLSVIPGVIATLFAAAVGSAFGGGNMLAALPLAALAFGLPVMATVMGASVLGYVAAARWRPTGRAVTGAVLGPVALGAVALASVGMAGLADSMFAASALAQDRAEVATESQGLHLTIDDVVSTLDDQGLVKTVRVRLTIRSDEEVALELLPGKLVYPLFVIAPKGGDVNAEIQAEAPPGSPSVLAAGSETHYDVLFDPSVTGTPSRGGAGPWLLSVRMSGADGTRYGLESMIEVTGS